MDPLKMLQNRGVSQELIDGVAEFRRKFGETPVDSRQVVVPSTLFYGKEILEMAIAALLQGENILLSGSKATGKNVLADNLCWIFNRPSYNISFHVNTDSASLIGTDTFAGDRVFFRKGPIYQCAEDGFFGILDEINMAKSDALSVLHATLDFRRLIDVPGYDRIYLHEATRFIATMNYGYAGTRELNEALVSRFLVIQMPSVNEDLMMAILQEAFPDGKEAALAQFAGLFLDLQEKAFNSEISTKPIDLRGLIGALSTIRSGLSPALAVRMGITNKSFDVFEHDIIDDVVSTRIPDNWTREDVFR